MIKRKIKYVNFNTNYEIKQFGNWIDLATNEEVVLNSGEFKLIDLGIAMELPNHYEANVVPRSSLYKNFGIIQANHFGIIDSDYKGMNDRWKFPAISPNFNTMIPGCSRICQFRIQLSMNAPWYIKILDLFTTFDLKKVDILGKKSRGGFGSTGV